MELWSQREKQEVFKVLFDGFLARCGMNQPSIARAIDTDSSTISRWRNLKVRPRRLEFRDLLAQGLHLDYSELDVMLWLAGHSSLDQFEVRDHFGQEQEHCKRKPQDLQTKAAALLVKVVKESPAPRQNYVRTLLVEALEKADLGSFHEAIAHLFKGAGEENAPSRSTAREVQVDGSMSGSTVQGDALPGVLVGGISKDHPLNNDNSNRYRESHEWGSNTLSMWDVSPPRFVGRPDTLGLGLFGRQAELTLLRESFKRHRVVVLAGNAGCGKTRLAAEYTHRCEDAGFWTAAGEDLSRTLVAVAPELGINTTGRDDGDITEEVKRALGRVPPDTLWVADNITDIAQVNLLINACPARLLVTTRDSRSHIVPPAVKVISVDVLEPESAVRLLCSRKNDIAPNPALLEIAEAVGRLPLALEMLAVQLGQPRQTPERVLRSLQQAPTAVQIAAFQEATGATVPRIEGVFATIASVLDDLPNPIRLVMAPLGYVADQPLSDSLLMAITGIDEDGLDGLLEECARRSLLTVLNDGVVIHALTSATIAVTNEADALSITIQRALDRLRSISRSDFAALRTEMEHDRRMLEMAKRGFLDDHERVLTFGNAVADAYHSTGRYLQAISLYEDILPTTEQKLGPDHLTTLLCRNSLGELYRKVSNYQEALALLKETLDRRNRVQGPEHPDSLRTRNDLAFTYQRIGDLQDAIEEFQEILRLRERVLGPDDPDTLHTKNNLAVSYRHAGRLSEAIQLNMETLEARVGRLGPDHPDTLQSQNNLAVSYRDSGNLQEAEGLHERTLKARERVLGPDHPHTLQSRSNVASTYRLLGNIKDAIAQDEEVLAIRRRVLGHSDRETLQSLNNLALSYCRDEQYKKAIQLHQEALEGREGALGPSHPDTLQSLHNLAEAYRLSGNAHEAIRLGSQAWARREQILGPEHPSALASRHNLALSLRDALNVNEAVAHLEQAASARRRVLGPDHPATQESLAVLKSLYGEIGRDGALNGEA